jgi:hypothetical protein
MVDIADKHTLEHALTYLYTGQYEDEQPLTKDEIVSNPKDSQSTSNGETCTVNLLKTDQNSSYISSHEAGENPTQFTAQLTEVRNADHPREPQLSADTNAPFADTRHSCTSPDCYCTKLRTNTFVYIVADYYQIPGLKHLAVAKFS